ncbi:MAG: hypothetical protein ACREU7_13680, partial [Burkholderiales bacterium]
MSKFALLSPLHLPCELLFCLGKQSRNLRSKPINRILLDFWPGSSIQTSEALPLALDEEHDSAESMVAPLYVRALEDESADRLSPGKVGSPPRHPSGSTLNQRRRKKMSSTTRISVASMLGATLA